MAEPKHTIPPVSIPKTAPGRIQSDRTWTPKKPPFTPRREYAFMRNFALLTMTQGSGGPFGPFNGGVQQ